MLDCLEEKWVRWLACPYLIGCLDICDIYEENAMYNITFEAHDFEEQN